MDYNDENDELVDNDEYDGDTDYDEELEDSFKDEQEEPVKRRRIESSDSEDLYRLDDIDSPSRLSPPVCTSRPGSSPVINLSDDDSSDF